MAKLFRKPSSCFFLLFTLLAALALSPALRAQDAPSVESRYLFVFDTSSAMKKFLPSETKTIKGLFVMGLNTQLRRGDSIGAWAFSRDVQTGEFPLEYWEPGKVMEISSSLADYAKSRHYSHTTTFDQLIPMLDQVVRTSPRLTVIIFCDGQGQVHGTPWDATINNIFQKHAATMKKAREPFIIIMRSQFGRYVGSTMNTPNDISFPLFPPLPQPPPPVVIPPPPPPPAPQPLIIIGTHVGTNLPPPTVIPQPPAPAKPVPPPVLPPPANPSSENSAPQTDNVPPTAISAPPTNAVASMAETVPPTPPPAAAAAASGMSRGHMLAAGAVVVILLGILGFLLFRPRHRAAPSLITESLKKDKNLS